MELTKWQEAVIDYLSSGSKVPASGTSRTQNLDYGVRVNFGRRAGHTTLAYEILRRFPDACLIVPHELDAKRAPAEIRDRVMVSSPGEAHSKRAIMEKNVPVLCNAKILVIDGASRISKWELETLRAAKWDRYVELES